MKSHKHILIRVDGSHRIGLGHIYRMRTLALALHNKGYGVTFLSQHDEIANSLLETTKLPCYFFQSDSYQPILAQVLQTQRPCLIIQDILTTSIDAMTMLRQCSSSAKILNFDDTGAGLMMADVVINSITFHWSQSSPVTRGAQLFEGAHYMILQSEIGNCINLNKEISQKITSLLLAFGGTDTHFVTERVLQSINEIKEPLKIKINRGPGCKPSLPLEQIIQTSMHHIEVMYAVPNLIEEFCQSDLVICAAGIMLYELAALGVPSLSIATEPHETYNTHYWSTVGTTWALGWEKTLVPTQITEALNSLIYDRQRRIEMSLCGRRNMDNQGLSRVLKIVEEALQ